MEINYKEELNKIQRDHLGRIFGIFAINKPRLITSHDIVYKVRKILQTKKVGHAGALDPFAEGILLVLVGNYTKRSEMLLKKHKGYRGRIIFGIKTNSGDIDGEIVQTKSETLEITEDLRKKIEKDFSSQYIQFVPIFSSVKIHGMKLRELARSSSSFTIKSIGNSKICEFALLPNSKFGSKAIDGKLVVEIPSKEVDVKVDILETGLLTKTEVIKYFSQNNQRQIQNLNYAYIDIDVFCSKGTYIRQLAEDIAESIGTVGTLVSLNRTIVDTIKLEDSITIEDLIQESKELGIIGEDFQLNTSRDLNNRR